MSAGEAGKAVAGYGGMDAGATVLEPGKRSFSRESEIIAGGLVILAGSFIFPYVQGAASRVTPGCLFHRVTGLPCLLCGMTRSLAATAHGRLEEAFRMHLLGPPLFLLVMVVTVLLAMESAFARPILPRPGRRSWRLITWVTLGLLVAAWVTRLALFGINV
jgi:hypothetical protein